MQMINKKITTLFTSITLLVLPLVASAAIVIEKIITNILDMIVWPIFIGAVVIMFVFAGFSFVTANGDPGKIGTAKKAVWWAIIGVIVGIAAFSAVGIIKKIIGV